MKHITIFLLLSFVALATIIDADAAISKTAKKICGDMLCSEVKACPKDQIRDPIDRKCYPGSAGWKITGYFLPLEKDYPADRMVWTYVSGQKRGGLFDYSENNSTYYLKQFKQTFLNEVAIQGSGMTSDGRILQSWQNDFISPDGQRTRFYHYGSCAATFTGVCLPVSTSSLNEPLIMVAVTHGSTNMTDGVIEHGTLLRIPDIPSPWNARTYWAVDIGEWRDKHIDIFTGYGKSARDAAYKITKLPPQEDSRVLAVGFKEAKP
ncbi:hypothetical protein [Candidatus Nitrosotenuis uzonensis]|uniref:3D domain-containing protein n=1 Tax=Candidatus Nitrosotenuis uzonensis TaxID=1407055 RepID=A0A812F949_9ARCH|nr:hypothetical protein [Candidatus Nitrosotenuis uzonensis]CAE6500769.1 conserved exported hypothetical protein [Candidatus Nitrosotenuis uzonensis]